MRDIFEPVPELSPDLDWMLQSGQASVEMLLEALMSEFSQPVYRLALAMLDDPEAARRAARRIFIQALLNLYQYRERWSAQTWFFRVALEVLKLRQRRLRTLRSLKASLPFPTSPETFGFSAPKTEKDAHLWLALDNLPAKARTLVLFHSLLGWSLQNTAFVLGESEKALQIQLTNALKKLQISLRRSGVSFAGAGEEELDAQVRASLASRWPESDFSEADWEQEKAFILERVGRLDSRRKRSASVKEFTFTGIGVLIVVALIWVASNLLPDDNPAATATPRTFATQLPRAAGAVRHTPRPHFTPPVTWTPTPFPKNAFYTVELGDTLQKISEKLGTTIEELQQLNRMAPGDQLSAGQRLLVPGSLDFPPLPSATPVPQSIITPTQKIVATKDDLIHLVEQNLKLRPFWLDAQVLDYGPAGYVGPPDARRFQLWMGSDQTLSVYGLFGDLPSDVILTNNQYGTFRAQPAEGSSWFLPLSPVDFRQNPAELTWLSFFRLAGDLDESPSDLSVKILGAEPVAGRTAYRVHLTVERKQYASDIWVDASTGLILRRVEFERQGSPTLRREIVVKQILFNTNFPQDLFDPRLPWRGSFALGPNGRPIPQAVPTPTWDPVAGHEPWPYSASPAGFDPAKSPLTFQFPQSSDSRQAITDADVFAGRYYLGHAEIGNPWSMICARSPDGGKIAFVSQPGSSPTQNSFLYWFSLDDLVSRNTGQLYGFHSADSSGSNIPLGGIYVTNFAFSPDSQRLAAFGFDGQFVTGAIYIIDLQTGEYRQLIQQGDVRSLVWSPDGKTLAFIGRGPAPLYQDEVFVVRADGGGVVFRRSIDFKGGALVEGPIKDWVAPDGSKVDFPVEMGSLEDCIAAPQP